MAAIILHIETATPVCSVALAKDGIVTTLQEQNTGSYTHAENLHIFIENVLRQENLTYKELSAVAVSSGPGSYTGLRIGTSAAKGLCYALDIPLISVSTLKALAEGVLTEKNGEPALYLPMIDARRMEVFTLGMDEHGQVMFDTRAEVVTKESFPEGESFQKVYYFGDGADKCADILDPERFILLPDKHASAAFMAPLAFAAYKNQQFVNTAYFEPFYLKEFVAGKPKKLL